MPHPAVPSTALLWEHWSRAGRGRAALWARLRGSAPQTQPQPEFGCPAHSPGPAWLCSQPSQRRSSPGLPQEQSPCAVLWNAVLFHVCSSNQKVGGDLLSPIHLCLPGRGSAQPMIGNSSAEELLPPRVISPCHELTRLSVRPCTSAPVSTAGKQCLSSSRRNHLCVQRPLALLFQRHLIKVRSYGFCRTEVFCVFTAPPGQFCSLEVNSIFSVVPGMGHCFKCSICRYCL